jgi:hypothetical protein
LFFASESVAEDEDEDDDEEEAEDECSVESLVPPVDDDDALADDTKIFAHGRLIK